MMLEMPVAASPYNHLIFFVTFHSMQFPITAIREIRILKKLQHENVIKLKEIVTSPGTCFIYLFNMLKYISYLLWMCHVGREGNEQAQPGNNLTLLEFLVILLLKSFINRILFLRTNCRYR